MNGNPQWMLIALIAIAALLIIGLIAVGVRRRRTAVLRDHFGSEYQRVVEKAGSRTTAEEELAARAEEVRTLDIRELTVVQRERYRSDWKAIEARFVDRPTTAVVEADELIVEVMRARGYPTADFEKSASLVSVKHPGVVEHYRAGHAAIDKHGRGAASTEDLRQAMLHYRALFEELVGIAGTDVVADIATAREIEPLRAVRQTPAARDEDRLRD